MSARVTISAPEKKDTQVLGDLLLRSKLSLSINRLLWKNWPNETAQRKQYTAAVAGAFKDPNMLDLKATNNETGQIVGYICLTKKERKAQPEVNASAQPQDEGAMPAASWAPPAEMSPNVLAGVGKVCQEVASGLNFPENYGGFPDIVFVVVDRLYRGTGVGSQLLQRGFAEARAAGIPFCVVSEPAARSFFDRFGFKEVVYADMDLSVWAPPYSGFGVFRLTGMVWRPEWW